ncbi:MAG: hypothetical protein SOI17_06015 [Lactococcus cremoris]
MGSKCLYHVTTKKNYSQILKDKSFREISIPNLSDKKKPQKDPGTLGYGLYAFEVEWMAESFNKNNSMFLGKGKKLKFSIVSEEFTMLDLLDQEDYHRFYIYLDMIKEKHMYQKLNEWFNNQERQATFHGALLEIYIRYLENKGNEIELVRAYTSNDIGHGSSVLSNGVEYCIRENQIISNSSISSC